MTILYIDTDEFVSIRKKYDNLICTKTKTHLMLPIVLTNYPIKIISLKWVNIWKVIHIGGSKSALMMIRMIYDGPDDVYIHH